MFYGRNETGSSIIRFTIIVTIFDCLYMVLNSLLQSLNRKQIIYKSVITGLIINLFLDVPFMYLFGKLGLKAYYGAILATFTGFVVSNIMSLLYLKKNMQITFSDTLKALPRAVVSYGILILLCIVFNKVLGIPDTRIKSIIYIIISGVIAGGIYLVLNLKELKTILPEKLIKKLHLG